MSEGQKGFIAGLILASLVAALVGLLCFQEVQRNLVKHGVAEYYLDADNNRQFRWKECGE